MAALPALTRAAELQAWKIAVERSRFGSGSLASPWAVEVVAEYADIVFGQVAE